jgi:hypothetical protein
MVLIKHCLQDKDVLLWCLLHRRRHSSSYLQHQKEEQVQRRDVWLATILGREWRLQ